MASTSTTSPGSHDNATSAPDSSGGIIPDPIPDHNQLKYKPLDKSRREVRFVLLNPSLDEDGKLQCNLVTEALEDMGDRYIALSYCWGDPNVTVPIKLNGHDHRIPTNLADFLKRIRTTHEEEFRGVLLWIDALCINQEDLLERNHQVPLMRAIYQSAARVVAWLGEVEENSEADHGMEVLTFLYRTGKEYAGGQWLLDLMKGKKDRAGFIDKTASPILAIVERPWWGRRWIIQEVVLGKSLLLFCGKSLISWEDFAYALLLWQVFCLKSGFRDAYQKVPTIKTIVLKSLAADYHYLRKAFHDPDSINPLLLDLLAQFRSTEQALPHDSIYALQGLASDYQDFLPDYGKPAVEVFVDFALKCIDHAKNVDILDYCQNEFRSGMEWLPSWAPNWTTHYGRTVDDGHPFNSSLNSQASFSTNRKHRILTVEAVKIGSILAYCKLTELFLGHASME